MSNRNRIPPTIEPYLRIPPEKSLILLTGTLGCSANWLTALFLGGILGSKSDAGVNVDGDGDGKTPCVLFVSWMRDYEFWRDLARRTTSLDISKLEQQGRFSFLNCLNPPTNPEENTLSYTAALIQDAISKLKANPKNQLYLILDSPDILLATYPTTTPSHLNKTLLHLRTQTQTLILTCSADTPLITSASSSIPASHAPTPIEISTAAFLTQQAHAARFVMSVRELSTGAARDVSGVLRVTRGGGGWDFGSGADAGTGEGESVVGEMEVLYLVQRDGGVKIFGRGEGSG